MRFHTLRLRGISEAFRQDVEVNFDGLPGLIAIVGENGAGKSTLIGALFASFYSIASYPARNDHYIYTTSQQTPSRKSTCPSA